MTATKIILTSFVITAGLLTGSPTVAQPAAQATNTLIVRTADLDLSTLAGRSALDHRLVNAAIEACGNAADVDLAGHNAVRHCRHDVLAEARAKADQAIAGRTDIQVAAGR
jgi:UrcA family protein